MSGRDKPIEYWSTPMLKGRLMDLLDELGYRGFGKRPKLSELVDWAIHHLADGPQDDPKVREAVAIARYWWEHERSSK